MYNILTLNKISKYGLEKLDPAKYACGDAFDAPDAIMVRSAAMHDMAFAPETLAIARCGAGTNNIPVDICAEKGIVVFNTPGANANAVKELVLCALFLTSRKIVAGIDWCKGLKGEGANVGKAVEKGKGSFVGPEILGKTLGVFGLGAIGLLVAKAAAALGMDIVAYDPFYKGNDGFKVVDNLDEFFAAADYITLHAPLNDSTKSIINADAFAKMKDGVSILNFARGELVESADMIAALASGKVAAYATDFPTDEQLCVDGVIAIPHLGASTPESEDNCAVMAAEELVAYLEKGEIKNSVNLPNTALAASFDKRTCVIHKDDEAVTAAVNAVLGAGAVTAAKKGWAYTAVDAAADIAALEAIDGVSRVRVIG